MKIAVVSPINGSGVTTISILLADLISRTVEDPDTVVMLAHNSPENLAFQSYLNLENSADRTRSLTQVIKLLEINAISGDEIIEYTIERDKIHIFDNGNAKPSPSELLHMYDEIYKTLRDQDVFVMDISEDENSDETLALLNKMDIVVVVIDQSIRGLTLVKNWMRSDFYKNLDKKNIMFFLNNYDPKISDARKISKELRIQHKNMVTFPRNPYVVRCGNIGKLPDLITYAMAGDPRLFPVIHPLKDFLKFLSKKYGANCNWKDNK